MPSSYDDYDVTQLFQAVRDASEQLAPSRAQVLAWRRAVQALDKHRERLDSLRGQLAAKWPPETNAASAAYLRELDRLIDAVHQTSVAAASNQVHIEHVANAIDSAKREIEPLHEEYVENRTKLAQYENTLNEVGEKATYVSGPLGGYLARKGAGIVLAPPVADGRQEELSRQARARMAPLTSTVADAVSNMHAPPKYEPPVVERPIDPGSRIAGRAGGGAIRPPAIDPPAHAREKLATTGAGDGANGNNGSVSGPGLEGVIAPAPPPVVVRPPDVGGSIGTPLPVTGLPVMPPMLLPEPPLPTAPAATGRFLAGPQGGPGVIGGNGAAPLNARPGAAGPSRVNPVGGVIGGANGARPGAGVPANGQLGGPGMPGSRRPGQQPEERAEWRRRDPENPWETAEGVAPVIEPGRVNAVDPGPGILGMDR